MGTAIRRFPDGKKDPNAEQSGSKPLGERTEHQHQAAIFVVFISRIYVL